MSDWTVIPPWLYQNDLPDDRLQQIYVEGARRKLAALLNERPRPEMEIRQMRALLADAEEALAYYRWRARG